MATVTKKFLNDVVYGEEDLAAFLGSTGLNNLVKLRHSGGNIEIGDGAVVMDGYVYMVEGYDFLAPREVPAAQLNKSQYVYFGYNIDTLTHSWTIAATKPVDPLGFTQYQEVLVYNTNMSSDEPQKWAVVMDRSISGSDIVGEMPIYLGMSGGGPVVSRNYLGRLRDKSNAFYYLESFVGKQMALAKTTNWDTAINPPFSATAINTEHVELSGAVRDKSPQAQNPGGVTNPIAYLPVYLRPDQEQVFTAAYMEPGGGLDPVYGTTVIIIKPNGSITTDQNIAKGSTVYLDGIRYRVARGKAVSHIV